MVLFNTRFKLYTALIIVLMIAPLHTQEVKKEYNAITMFLHNPSYLNRVYNYQTPLTYLLRNMRDDKCFVSDPQIRDALTFLKELLDAGTKTNITALGRSPLHLAIGGHNNKAFTMLLEYGAEHDPSWCEPPIVTAIEQDNLAALKILLEKGVCPNLKNSCSASYDSLITTAIKRRRPEALKILLNKGASPSSNDLAEACQAKSSEAFQLFVKNEDALTTFVGDRLTTKAIKARNFEALEILLKYGAKMDQDDLTRVIELGNVENVKLFLTSAQPFKDVNTQHRTHIEVAIKTENIAIVDTLLRRGYRDYSAGNNNLFHITASTLPLNSPLFKKLLNSDTFGGVDCFADDRTAQRNKKLLNQQNSYGKTPYDIIKDRIEKEIMNPLRKQKTLQSLECFKPTEEPVRLTITPTQSTDHEKEQQQTLIPTPNPLLLKKQHFLNFKTNFLFTNKETKLDWKADYTY